MQQSASDNVSAATDANFLDTFGIFERFAVLSGAINIPDPDANETALDFSLSHLSIYNSALTEGEVALLHDEVAAPQRSAVPFEPGTP